MASILCCRVLQTRSQTDELSAAPCGDTYCSAHVPLLCKYLEGDHVERKVQITQKIGKEIPKYFIQVSVCLSFIQRSLHFSLSYPICLPYLEGYTYAVLKLIFLITC
jgi:hypothetical protein